MTHTYTLDEEELNERYALVTERIAEISTETIVPGAYGAYMHEVADFLENLAGILSADADQNATSQEETKTTFQDQHDTISSEAQAVQQIHQSTISSEEHAMQQIGEFLSVNAYATSFLNPPYAAELLGREPGQLLSFVYADIVAMVGPAMEGRIDIVTLWMELFVMLYGEFTAELEDPMGSLVSKELMHELKDTVYWFYHDNAEVILWDLADFITDGLKIERSTVADRNGRKHSQEAGHEEGNATYVANTVFFNPQMIADHQEDRAIYLDKGFLLRCEEILTDIYTKYEKSHNKTECTLDLGQIASATKYLFPEYAISLLKIFDGQKNDGSTNNALSSDAAIRLTQHQKRMEQVFYDSVKHSHRMVRS